MKCSSPPQPWLLVNILAVCFQVITLNWFVAVTTVSCGSFTLVQSFDNRTLAFHLENLNNLKQRTIKFGKCWCYVLRQVSLSASVLEFQTNHHIERSNKRNTILRAENQTWKIVLKMGKTTSHKTYIRTHQLSSSVPLLYFLQNRDKARDFPLIFPVDLHKFPAGITRRPAGNKTACVLVVHRSLSLNL